MNGTESEEKHALSEQKLTDPKKKRKRDWNESGYVWDLGRDDHSLSPRNVAVQEVSSERDGSINF